MIVKLFVNVNEGFNFFSKRMTPNTYCLCSIIFSTTPTISCKYPLIAKFNNWYAKQFTQSVEGGKGEGAPCYSLRLSLM